jgi:hypothetical protein
MLQAPEKFADRNVTPSGLYILGPGATFRPNGTVGVSVVQGVMNVSSRDGSIAPAPRGAATTIDADPALVQAMIARQFLQRDNTPVGMPPSRTVALLTVRATKAAARYATGGWVLVLVRAEFLVNLNLARISEQKYKQSFITYAFGQGSEGVGNGDSELWKARLGNHFLVNAGKAFKIFKSQMRMMQNAAINTMIGNMVGQQVDRQNRQNAAAAAATAEALKPRTIVPVR